MAARDGGSRAGALVEAGGLSEAGLQGGSVEWIVKALQHQRTRQLRKVQQMSALAQQAVEKQAALERRQQEEEARKADTAEAQRLEAGRKAQHAAAAEVRRGKALLPRLGCFRETVAALPCLAPPRSLPPSAVPACTLCL